MATGPPISYRPDFPKRFSASLWACVLVVFCLLYFATAQRGASWQDSGMFQWRALTGDYAGRFGLALAHPLYIAAGRVLAAASERHLPLLLNCSSGLGMAVALANIAALVAMLTDKRWAGLLTAGALGTTHTVWWLSTIAETYTWSAAGLTGELLLLTVLLSRPRWRTLAGLAFVNGLGLCVHNLALLALPVYLGAAVWLVLRRKLPYWSLAVAAGAYLVGSGLYLGMTVELAVRSGSLSYAIRSALFGNYAEQVLNVAEGSRYSPANAALSVMNFLNLLMPLAAVGWFRMRRRLGGATAAALGAITLIEMFFFVRYPVPDQFMFILPTLVMVAVAAGLGLAALADRSVHRRAVLVAASLLSIVWQPVLYAAAPSLVRRFAPSIRHRQRRAFRNEMRYWMVPWKHDERSAERFAQAAFEQAAPGGAILPDNTAAYPLLVYQRQRGAAPGVTVLIGQAASPRPPRQDKVPPEAFRKALDEFQNALHAFRKALGERPLYVVKDAWDDLSERLGKDAEPVCEEGQVLCEVRWKDR